MQICIIIIINISNYRTTLSYPDYLFSFNTTNPFKLEPLTPQKPFYLQNIISTNIILDHGQYRHITIDIGEPTPLSMILLLELHPKHSNTHKNTLA